MPEPREVVITGLGAVTPYGRGIAPLWDALTNGHSAIDTITSFDASALACRVAGEVRDYEPHEKIDPQHAGRLDRAALFAADAALQAIDDSGLEIDASTADFVGLVIGSARPGEHSAWRGHATFHEAGAAAMTAGFIGRTLANASAAQAAAALGVRGPVLAVSAGGASASVAIAEAARMIRAGDVQVAIAGGADAAITPPALAAFAAMGILTKHNDNPPAACRPFDAAADGFAVSEGAAVLVLEDDALAQQRGAHVYARLDGAANITQPGGLLPSTSEAGRALQAALRQPALMQQEIDYYCAYAAGSPQLDRMESDAIKRIFGDLTASKLTISAPKSMLGHMLGASGAIDAIVCAQAIKTGLIPPTINLEHPAPGCDLDYTPGTSARELSVRHAMTYAYGFGGHHVSLVLSAP